MLITAPRGLAGEPEEHMPNFETFSRAMSSLRQAAHVTIHKRGTISLNRPAYEALGAPGAVDLLFDRDARVLGIRPSDGARDEAHLVRATTRSASGPWLISAAAFTRYYDIDTATSARWPAGMVEGVLCADLTRPGMPVTSNRAGKGRRED